MAERNRENVMEWKNGAKSAFALGFDLDGETIWINKTRALPNGNAYIKAELKCSSAFCCSRLL